MTIARLLGDEHWIAIPKTIAADQDLSQSAKLLYAALLDYCIRFDSRTVFPSQESLAKAIGLTSRRQLERATKELVARDFVITRRRGPSGSTLSYYVLAVSSRSEVPE